MLLHSKSLEVLISFLCSLLFFPQAPGILHQYWQIAAPIFHGFHQPCLENSTYHIESTKEINFLQWQCWNSSEFKGSKLIGWIRKQ